MKQLFVVTTSIRQEFYQITVKIQAILFKKPAEHQQHETEKEVFMKKVLFVGTELSDIDERFSKHLEFFKRNGYEVHLLGRDNRMDIDHTDQMIDFDFTVKSGFNVERKQIKQLQALLLEEKYTAIISYEDMPGYLIRMAAKSAFKPEQRPKIFYLAIEYPFYGDPSGKEEKKCFERHKKAGKVTDLVIVSNDTDLHIAEEFNFSMDTIVKLYGMGVEPIARKIRDLDPESVRKQYRLTKDYVVALYENNYEEDKNHIFLIRNIMPIIERFPNFKLVWNGRGEFLSKLKEEAEREGVSRNILFLEKEDVSDLYAICDIYISPSLIEGIPEGIVHALECRLPVLAARTKGNVDLIEDGENGVLFGPDNCGDFIAKLYVLLQSSNLREQFAKQKNTFVENYFTDYAQKHIFNYYRKMIVEDSSRVLNTTSNFNEED